MDNASPNDDNINWWCWDCAPKDSINEQLRKSERISSKKQKVLESRNLWKERFSQNKRVVQISNELDEVGQSASDPHSPIADVELQLLKERQKDPDILKEKKSISSIPSHSKEDNKSTIINDPAFATKSTLQLQEENIMASSDETRREVAGKKKRILVVKDSDMSKDEDKTVDPQVLSFVANDQCISSQTLSRQLSLEPDDCVSAEPSIDPKWRGWFNIKEEDNETCVETIKEEDNETCVEILAHLSNKACSKVCDAVSAIPDVLDIQVMDRGVVWPKSFRVSPPSAASIALYFFPISARDEKLYDSLLDEVIERDLALKAMINNVELLIFSSLQLPLQQWRFNHKYYFWGVFRQKQKQHSRSSTETSRQNSTTENTEPTNNKDLVHPESADSLFRLSKLDTIVELHDTLQIEEQKLEGKNQASDGDSRHARQNFLRPFSNTDNASVAEVV